MTNQKKIPSIRLQNINKVFDETQANHNVNFICYPGEVHCLIGGNGAGKSTLMKILYGMLRPDSGEIFINEKYVVLDSSKDAIDSGLWMVHQEFMLSGSMTAADNIILGSEPVKGIRLDRKTALNKIKSIQKEHNLNFPPESLVSELSAGEMQRVEIVKALYRGTRILILDEPTSLLSAYETGQLFKIIRSIIQNNGTVIFITHKINEMLQIADRVTVLDNGQVKGNLESSNLTEKNIHNLLLGDVKIVRKEEEHASIPDSILTLNGIIARNTAGRPKLKNFSLSLYKGEILGICGVEGNGQQEIEGIFTGEIIPDEGTIFYKTEKIDKFFVKSFLREKTGIIPSKRIEKGMIGNFSIEANLMLDRPDNYFKGPFQIWDRPLSVKNAKDKISSFEIKPADFTASVKKLSGGNQQKVVLARELGKNPEFIIASNPTRGVDFRSTQFIHQKLLALAQSGVSILLISTDLDEILKLSYRIGILYEGKIISVLSPDSADKNELSFLMMGGEHPSNSDLSLNKNELL